MKKTLKACLILSSIHALSLHSMAQAQTVHTVSHGDYLWLIANRYGVTVQNIKDWNQLSSNYLRTGDQLIVSPPGETEVQTETELEWSQDSSSHSQPVIEVTTTSSSQASSDYSNYYIVQPGDYLYKIASQFGVSVNDLKAWNHLTSNYLYSGTRLIVGQSSLPVNPPVTETSQAVTTEKQTSTSPSTYTSKLYTVKKGDYLYKIAQQFGVTVQQIKDWNHMTSNYIYVGNQLRVSEPALVTSTTEQTTSQPVTTENSQQEVTTEALSIESSTSLQESTQESTSQVSTTESAPALPLTYHTVVQGDYLYKIAQTYGVTVQDIKDWNHLSTNYIYSGSRLIVSDPRGQLNPNQEILERPAYYDVVYGDNLSSIAQKFSLSQSQIMTWNQMKDTGVYVGDRLFLKETAPIKIQKVSRDLPQDLLVKTLGGPLSAEALESLKQMKVTLIGDSIAYGIRNLLGQESFAAYNFDAKISRRWEYDPDKSLDGLYALQEMVNQGSLNDYVVFILGTNYGASQDQLDRAMALIGPNRKALFVDTASEVKVRDSVNHLYAQHSLRYPNAYYVDWSNPALKQHDWFYGLEYSNAAGDYIRLHPNNIGRPVLKDYIIEALYQLSQFPQGDSFASPSSPLYYTVRPGDYLYKIAQIYGVTVDNLRQWNQLTSNYIYSGDQLMVRP